MVMTEANKMEEREHGCMRERERKCIDVYKVIKVMQRGRQGL